MKNSLILMAFLCLIGNLNAQFKLGLRTNFAVSTTQSAETELAQFAPLELINFKASSASNSFSYGLALYNSNERLFFMTEALYRTNTVNFQAENMIGDFTRGQAIKEFEYSTSSIHVPISAGVKIKNFKIGAGPTFNWRLDSNSTLVGIDNISVSETKLTTGFSFLVGYELMDHIHIDLKREINFNRSGENYSYLGDPIKLDSSPSYMSLSLGLFF